MDTSNDEYVDIQMLLGRSTSFAFIHVGTSFCRGMTIEGEEKVKPYLHMLKLVCRTTPQVSEIFIEEPVKELEGLYHIK